MMKMTKQDKYQLAIGPQFPLDKLKAAVTRATRTQIAKIEFASLSRTHLFNLFSFLRTIDFSSHRNLVCMFDEQQKKKKMRWWLLLLALAHTTFAFEVDSSMCAPNATLAALASANCSTAHSLFLPRTTSPAERRYLVQRLTRIFGELTVDAQAAYALPRLEAVQKITIWPGAKLETEVLAAADSLHCIDCSQFKAPREWIFMFSFFVLSSTISLCFFLVVL